jgi:ribosomal protection tetracycline resistance protein
MRTLNLGILAHVDAGKTSLTERLLYAAGVIDAIGSVDDGNTQTDSLALERERGITIKSAVASFVVDDVAINLIDTPGHPDFIAEVERVLSVLDGAVLVISAVEGVQAQTRILMRALQRLEIPTLLFVNKIDRGGARYEGVLAEIREKLTTAIVPLGSVVAIGARAAEFAPFEAVDRVFVAALAERLADHDDAILGAWLEGSASLSYRRLCAGLAAQTRRSLVCPVFFGSAITGAGVEALMAALTRFLPAAGGRADDAVSGSVFKIERGPSGERIAFVRMFGGEIRTRDKLRVRGDDDRKVTAIRVFDRGAAVPRPGVAAGQIGKLWGLGDIRIGDAIGAPRALREPHHFAPPTLETAIVPRRAAQKGALHAALAQLAEQDPLIDLRQDDLRGEMFLSLYGEVQKEVIEETLASDFGLQVEFRETSPICIERPLGVGEAVEYAPNPFIATVGLRIEPAAINSGVEFVLEVEFGSMPLSFHKAVEESVCETLRQGLHGWRVTDCRVAMTHGIRYRHWATSTPAEHRNLTPLVLMSALGRAGTRVFEPMHRLTLEFPADTLGLVLPVLARLGAVPRAPTMRGAWCTMEGEIAAARVHALRQALPSVTRGEGVLETAFDHYQPVQGPIPTRPRSDHNPLDRKEYLKHVLRRP